MFSNDDILVLAKAGFNAQQIAALNIVGTAPEKAPEAPAPTPAEPKAPEAPEAPAEPKAPEAPAQGATIDDVLKSISGLTEAFKISNLQSMQQPKPVTAEDILAEIINPPLPKGGKE